MNKQPQRISALMPQNPPSPDIVNPARRDYEQRQQKSQKAVPKIRLWVAFKQPSPHSKWSWTGVYLAGIFSEKYGRKFSAVEAIELKLEQIMDKVKRAVIYDNRPESKYPVWKEYLNGKLIVDNSNKQ